MKSPSLKKIVLVTAICATITAVGSCAYFNTLYNARKIYAEAEETRIERGGEFDRGLSQKYDEVITKCAMVIRDYPDSRWVDDAIFLMGQALVRQGEFDKGIRKFVELTTNFPESDYVPSAIYWQAKANYEKEEYNQALQHTDRFLEAFPRHDLRFDVLFLAGDISAALKDNEGALGYYSKVAEESGKGEHKRLAVRRSADLYFQLEDWLNAAAGYESVLGKGMKWSERYDVTLSLAKCYTKVGRCKEALALYDDLLAEIATTKEKPQVRIGKAASFVCMDSLLIAIREYKEITKTYPRSNYSAEAFFHLAVIYHERLDSLRLAQDAYSKVSYESASSEFASISLQRASSLKRLLELQERTDGGDESVAEKRFLAAEIQLTRLSETELALRNYQSVVDSFPGTSYAPKAAYAIGWIYRTEIVDTTKAVEAFSRLIMEYPVSPQARGAIDEIGLLGDPILRNQLAAYVDSAIAEMERIEEEKERVRLEAAAAAAASIDSTMTQPLAPDSLGGATGVVPDSLGGAASVVPDSLGGATGVVPDSLGTVPTVDPGDEAVDTSSAGVPSTADTTQAPPAIKNLNENTDPTGGESDSSTSGGTS